jgi:cell division protein FtsI/penicillin-binding protein 2
VPPDHPQYNVYRSRPDGPDKGNGAAGKAVLLSLALVAILAGAGAAVWFLLLDEGEGPQPTLDAFLADWSGNNDLGASGRTDDPKAAAADLRRNRDGLDGAQVKATTASVKEDGDNARATVQMTWTVPAIGEWKYDTEVRLTKTGDKWIVHWEPTVVHPELDADTRLGTVREGKNRGSILDRDGKELVAERDVIRVGAIAGDVKDPAATARGLARVLDVNARTLQRQIEGGGPEQFIEAITLRSGDYAKVAGELRSVPDVETIEGTAQLGPTREFGRAVLGTVGQATEEQVQKSGGRLAPGDSTGQFGLSSRFDERLMGIPERQIVIRPKEGGAAIDVLQRKRGRKGRDVRTTLDYDTQSAAERALGPEKRNAALVAIQPSTGDILAVANRPGDSSYDRAIEGLYPPGSTFKVVSTAALLRDGLKPSETVDCPATITVDGRQFKNFEGGAAGAVPFSRDFATSCNTAFVSLADRVDPADLPKVAKDYGLGEKIDLPLNAATASVPAPESGTERAASMIGQSKIVVSPLAMAGVAGTVADGRWRSPKLVPGDPEDTGKPLPDSERSTLRSLMRSVVTGGTGTALSSVPGEPAGKSGTAEFGSGNPPPTHAWFIAYRGDLALAVLVEGGEAGGRVAAPIAERFLSTLSE